MRLATSYRWSRRHPSCASGPAAREPYRALLRSVHSRLLATRESIERSLSHDEIRPGADVYVDTDDLTAALALCHTSLEKTGNVLIAAGRLSDVLRRTWAFGLTLRTSRRAAGITARGTPRR